ILASIHHEFSMTDLGALNYFLGISVTRDSSGMFLSQRKYAIEILKRAQMVSLYIHDLREPYFSALKQILQYAGCPTTRRSTSGYCVFHGNNLLSCSSKRQLTLSRSSAEAEYRGVSNCDNVSVVYLSSNPVQHKRTKHITIDIHFVRDLVATSQVRILHVPSRFQHVDPNTKMVVIWNPTVRKSVGIDILVPKGMYIKEEWIVAGFGVCPDTSDVKLVKIIDDKISSMWVVEVFLDGVIYFLVYDVFWVHGSRLNLDISFDLKSEKFGEVCLPEILVHTPNLNVTKVNESLGLLKYYDKGDMKVCGFRSNGKVVMELDDDNYKDSRIAIYEPLSGHINDVGINGDLCTLYAWSYMETLLLLDEADSIIL
nr:hypothetical protein [Tanacetum cinerariifolium]